MQYHCSLYSNHDRLEWDIRREKLEAYNIITKHTEVVVMLKYVGYKAEKIQQTLCEVFSYGLVTSARRSDSHFLAIISFLLNSFALPSYTSRVSFAYSPFSGRVEIWNWASIKQLVDLIVQYGPP